jgi:hypothetical protein
VAETEIEMKSTNTRLAGGEVSLFKNPRAAHALLQGPDSSRVTKKFLTYKKPAAPI